MSRKARMEHTMASPVRQGRRNRLSRALAREDLAEADRILYLRATYEPNHPKPAGLTHSQRRSAARETTRHYPCCDLILRPAEHALMHGGAVDEAAAFSEQFEQRPVFRLAKHTIPTAVQVRWHQSVLSKIQDRRQRRAR